MKPLFPFYKNPKITIYHIYGLGALLCILAAGLSLMLGSAALSLEQLLAVIFGKDSDPAVYRIFWYSRFPRTIACLLTGGALAVAGALIQGVLANKLASPSIIGVNSGAGLAVTLCTALGLYGGWQLSLFAFLGAFLSVLLISAGARKFGAGRGTVLLAGVALNSFWNAISQTIITFSPELSIMSNDFKVGDFSSVTYVRLIPATVLILVSLAFLLTLSNELDILTLGEENARGLGMDAGKMRMIFLLFAAVLSGCAVSLSGLLSFVGLLVPHTVRRFSGSGSKHLLPLCVLYGAGFVTLCDLISRTLFAPYEIPVGIILSFIGAPFFLLLLLKKKGGHL